MQLVFLGIVFLVIVILLALKRPLYQAILGALIAAALLYRIPPRAILSQTARVFTDWNSFSVLVSLYLITYLQRMLEARSQIKLAQLDLNGLFHNRRVNAAGAPLFIGLLPSAAAMILCADIVKDSTDGYLDPKEQAFVTSWFRHIPESTLPTYTGVLLMASLSGQPLGRFMLGMIIPMLILALVGYFPYFLRLPRDPGTPRSENRARDALNLVKHLWSLLLILVLILAFDFQVVTAVLTVIVLAAFVYRFSFAELKGFLVSAFEVKLLLNTFLILVLKEFISYTGVLTLLPAAKVGFIGLYRDEQTLQPVEYFCKLPQDIAERDVLVLDPMLATGGSADAAISEMKKRGCKHIKLMVLVAAPEGIKCIQEKHPDVDIYAGALDDHLNEHGYIVPGLGDAGDRIFGTK